MTVENENLVNDQVIDDAETSAFLEEESNAGQENELIDEPSQNENESDDSNNDVVESDESELQSESLDDNAGKTLSEQERYKAMAAEERNRRRETQKQIENLAKENESLKNTFNKILAKAQEQAQADQDKANVPSFEENPIEALKYQNEQLRKQVEQINKQEQDRQQMTAQQREMAQREQAFVGTYKQRAKEFEQTTPDFKDAYNFLLENREQEHRLAGYSDEQVQRLLVEDEAAIVATAFQNEQNPAKVLYDIAKLRGYKAKSTISAQQQINANQEKIANLERGLKASKSVSSGGVNARDSLTLEAVANMSEEELDQVDWGRLMKMG